MQIVVDFTASWCGPCRFITPFLVELAKKIPTVTFLKVDVDELKVNPSSHNGKIPCWNSWLNQILNSDALG